jgi:hypothetical protein
MMKLRLPLLIAVNPVLLSCNATRTRAEVKENVRQHDVTSVESVKGIHEAGSYEVKLSSADSLKVRHAFDVDFNKAPQNKLDTQNPLFSRRVPFISSNTYVECTKHANGPNSCSITITFNDLAEDDDFIGQVDKWSWDDQVKVKQRVLVNLHPKSAAGLWNALRNVEPKDLRGTGRQKFLELGSGLSVETPGRSLFVLTCFERDGGLDADKYQCSVVCEGP